MLVPYDEYGTPLRLDLAPDALRFEIISSELWGWTRRTWSGAGSAAALLVVPRSKPAQSGLVVSAIP